MSDTRRDVLAQALREIRELKLGKAAAEARAHAPIAVVGLGCRLPGADDPAALWRLLCAGTDATREVPPGRWTDEPPGIYSRRGGWLGAVDGFDARFFGISPREARTLDPQQRLFLEVAWESLEHAAIAPERLRDSRTGVWCGVTQVDYTQLLAAHALAEQVDLTHAGTGTALNFAAGRVARLLDLRGPAIAVDTACSSSLIAVHLAIAALRSGAVDLALAGGVNLILHPAGHLVLCRSRVLARDGRCRTFDAAADGYARGEGCGLVVLARLDDARRAGHRILAVLRGSAANHDGASAGLTVPSGRAQAEVITAACVDAGVAPRDVAYVEAHGTGTALGDPIEVRALASALGRDRAAPLLLGALKANLGHLESAAGIAGLLKTILAVAHAELPPHIGMTRPNPAIDWAALPVEVVQTRRPWPTGPRIAGVSAFGASGTNVHVIVAADEADPASATQRAELAAHGAASSTQRAELAAHGATSATQRADLTAHAASDGDGATQRADLADEHDAPAELLVLSAATPAALAVLAARHADLSPPAGSLADIGHTHAIGRAALPWAVALVAASPRELADQLAAVARGDAPGTRRPDAPVPVGFVFAGQGGPRPTLPSDLYALPGAFRDALERCDASLRAHRPGSLIDLLAAPAGPGPLDATDWAQPAIFAIEWALAEQWRAWGVAPRWVLGHSLGAYAAACVAGVIDLEPALALVARRAELMQRTPPGAMAAVFAGESVVRDALADLPAAPALAAINGPAELVISGPVASVELALQRLAERGLRAKRLAATRAFHSPLMDGVLAEFTAAVAATPLRPPDRVFLSDTTGRPATDAWTDPDAWRRHLREPVRFADALAGLRAAGCTLAVELGPAGALTALGRRQGQLRWVPSLQPQTPGRTAMLTALGRLAVAGARVDLVGASLGRRRVSLPTYPFERERVWVGPGGRSELAPAVAVDPLLGRRLPAPDGEARFVAEWRSDGPAVLRDHTVYGRCVVSGAVVGAVVLAAARELAGDRRHTLEALDFRAPIVLPENAGLHVELRLTRADDGHAFELASRDAGRTRVHVTGRLRPVTAAPPPARDLAEIHDRCRETLVGEAFYAALWDPERHGLGPSYRTLETIVRRDGEALARLRPPPAAPADLDPELHAAICLSEAAGQLLMPVVPDFAAVFAAADTTYLGSGMTRSVQHAPRLSPARWIHARLERGDPSGYTGEVALLDADGGVLVVLEGLAVRRVDRDLLRRASARAPELAAGNVLTLAPADRPAALRAWLGDTLGDIVGGPGFAWDDPLTRLGLDSLMTVDLLERIDAALAVRLDPGDASGDATPASLAARILASLASATSETSETSDAKNTSEMTATSATSETSDTSDTSNAKNTSEMTATSETSETSETHPAPDVPANAPARRDALDPTNLWRLIGDPTLTATRRLFCIPHAGATAMAFQPWRGHIPPGLEVRAAQLPGRWTDRGPPISALDRLVARLLADLGPLLDRPFALFGASMGGLLAFELARALQRAGGPQPTHLVVVGAAAPDGVHPLLARSPGLRDALAGPGDLAELTRLGLVPEAQLSPDLLALVLPALRADLELVLRHQHRPGPALACPISALCGSADDVVTRHDSAGWVAHTTGDFTLQRVEGGHLFYRDDPAATWRALARLSPPR